MQMSGVKQVPLPDKSFAAVAAIRNHDRAPVWLVCRELYGHFQAAFETQQRFKEIGRGMMMFSVTGGPFILISDNIAPDTIGLAYFPDEWGVG